MGLLIRVLGDALCPGMVDFVEQLCERDCDIPAWVMSAALREIAYVTDVVAFAIPVDVFEDLFLAADRGSHLEGFQDAHAVVPTPAQIVDFADSRRLPEFLDKSRDVIGMDVVANLLSLVAEDPVEAPLDITANQITQEAMQLDATMVGAG